MQAAQEDVRHQVVEVGAIQATLDPDSGSCAQRQAQFQVLQAQFQGSADPVQHHMGDVMAHFAPGVALLERRLNPWFSGLLASPVL